MSTFALHPVPCFDDLPPAEPPDEPFDAAFDTPFDAAFDAALGEPSDGPFDRPPDEEFGWGDAPSNQAGAFGVGGGSDVAFESDLQFFCRSAALHRAAGGYEGFAAARTLLEFARGHGDDEVLRWGPDRVSAFLRHRDPQGGHRSAADRERMLSVLRALVHFAHERLGVDPAWSMLALAAIEADADDYRCAAAREPVILQRSPLDDLADLVGGVEALATLESAPLVPFDAVPADASVPAALRTRVEEILGLTDRFAQAHFGVEFAIACHALVGRLVSTAPVALFRRDPTLTAAGIVWLVGRGNGLLQPEDAVRGVDVAAHFDVARGAYGRMHFLVRDVGCGLRDGGSVGLPLVIPDPAMQLASTRQAILWVRDKLSADLPGAGG